MFDGLVRFEPETLKIVPDIAENYDISPEGLTHTFRLRKGVLFHNGREVTAEDFRYSFERILDPRTRSERKWVLEEIDGAEEFSRGEADAVRGIEVPEKYVLRIRLRRPFGPFVSQLCMDAGSVVPREEVERWGDNFTSHPVGCGPYKFLSWKHDVDVVLEAFDRYYGGSPRLRRIVFRILPDPSVTKIFIVLGIVNWAGIARLVRGSLLSIKEREFAEAARALGVRPPRLMVRHLLPNALAPILVVATIGVAGNILTEAWLSFLGLGAQAPLASWGSMITAAQPFIYTRPWICLCPGLAIVVTVLGFNLLGDGLRDILDPRLARTTSY